MRPSFKSLLTTKSNYFFLQDGGVVNKNLQMLESQRQHDLHERWNYLLALVGKERKDVAKVQGISQANLTTWLTRPRGFTERGFVTLERWFRDQGIEGLTYRWLNDGIGDAPTRTGPAKVAPDSREITRLDTIGTRSAPAAHHGYIRFQFLKGFSREESPFVDIPSHLLGGDSVFLSEGIQAFINPTDTMRGEIEKGEMVFADTSVRNVATDKLVDGIYVYKLDGNAYIRRIQNRGKGVLRLSGTHAYEDSHELSGAELDGFEIGGLVVGSLTRKRF